MHLQIQKYKINYAFACVSVKFATSHEEKLNEQLHTLNTKWLMLSTSRQDLSFRILPLRAAVTWETCIRDGMKL
jgi:hypothetical protein